MNYITRLSKAGATLSLLLTLASCGGGSDAPSIEQVPVMPLAAVVDGVWPVGQYIFRTDADWQAAWNARGSTIDPPTAKPPVDFQRFVLVGFSAGTLPGCGGMRINSASRLADAYTVQYEIVTPAAGIACGGVGSPLLAFTLLPAPVESLRSELIVSGPR